MANAAVRRYKLLQVPGPSYSTQSKASPPRPVSPVPAKRSAIRALLFRPATTASAVAAGYGASYHLAPQKQATTASGVSGVINVEKSYAYKATGFILAMEYRKRNTDMAHQRSPNCPQITFAEAVEKGRLLYKNEHTHPASREVVAASLGYKGLNGRSLSMIGALRQYGIIAGSGDAMRVSEDAITYFELDSGEARKEALERMVFNPQMFAQIRSEFGETLPSAQNLKHYLIKQGFLPKAAEDVISVYQNNIRLLENGGLRYDEVVSVQAEPMSTLSTALVPVRNAKHPVSMALGLDKWPQTYSFPLSKDTVAELQIRGEITKEKLFMLRDMIELTIRALSADAPSSDPNKV